MGGDEGPHPVGIGLGPLAQRPPDALADEEVAVVEVGDDGVGEQVVIGRVLGAVLDDDRRASPPQVVVGHPRPHDRLDGRAVGAKDRPEQGDGDGVDVVPPRAGHDEVVVERDQ